MDKKVIEYLRRFFMLLDELAEAMLPAIENIESFIRCYINGDE